MRALLCVTLILAELWVLKIFTGFRRKWCSSEKIMGEVSYLHEFGRPIDFSFMRRIWRFSNVSYVSFMLTTKFAFWNHRRKKHL